LSPGGVTSGEVAGWRRGGPGRRALAAVAAFALVAVGLWGLAGRPAAGELVEVRRGQLLRTVEATGVLEAVEAVDLGPPQVSEVWEYKVTFLAPEGGELAAGAPVLRFDTSTLEQKLVDEQARAEEAARQAEKTAADLDLEVRDAELRLAEAESARRKAELAADVPEELAGRREREKGLVELARARADETFRRDALAAVRERRAAELRALGGREAAARARVRSLEQAIAAMTVRAPRAGTVVYVSDWRGEKPKVGDTVWRGRRVVTLPDLGRLRALLDVAEVDAGRLVVGQQVELRLDAHPDQVFRGEVARVLRAVGRLSANSLRKVVRAEVLLASVDPERMRPGMRLRAELAQPPGAAVLLLPRRCLDERATRPQVERVSWWGRSRVVPGLGELGRDDVEVVSGLAAGDRIRCGRHGGPEREPEEAS
jgi:HlyD family secretion protein